MDYVFYEVKRNDQLNKILMDHFGSKEFARNKSALVKRIIQYNPNVVNVDRIFPGQIIMLPDMHPEVARSTNPAVPSPVIRNCSIVSERLKQADPFARDLIAGLDYREVAMELTETGLLEFIEDATKGAIPDMKRIVEEYELKERGLRTKGQYDYRRSVAVRKIDYRLGPLHQLINPGKRPNEVLRINRHAAVRPQAIIDEVAKLERITKLAKNGSVVLKAAALTETGAKIHYAQTNEERTVLLFDAVGGFSGAALGAFLVGAAVATPVGWVAIIALSTATAAASVAGGLAGEAFAKSIQNNTLYDVNGNRIETSVDRAWGLIY